MARAGLGPRYWKVWGASATSNLSDGIQLIAAPLLAAALTRDPVLVAGLVVAQRLPWLLFPLLTGALVDRLDRRRAMGVSNVARAALIGALGAAVLFDAASLPLLYAVFFLLGAVETLYDNAAQAIVPAVVARENLEKANGRLYAAQLLSNHFAGPPLGGFLFGLAAAVPFLLGAGIFAASAALMLSLSGSYRPEKHEAPEGAPPGTLLTEIGEGLRWLFGQRLILLLAVMLGVFNAMFAATDAIMVLFAQDVLGLGAVGFGLLATCGAAGGLAASAASEKVVARLGSGRALVGCVLAGAASFLVVANTANPYLVGAMFGVSGFTAVVWNVVTVSLRQAAIPAGLFGRVNSVYRMIGWGGLSLGALLGGLLARQFGLAAPFWVAAAVLLLMAALTFPRLNNRALAELRG